MEMTEITDVIARDTWTSTGADGSSVTHEIIVGRPFRMPDDEKEVWGCLVVIENFTDRIVKAQGAGPVDALMNAMILVKALFDKIHKQEEPTNCHTNDSRAASAI